MERKPLRDNRVNLQNIFNASMEAICDGKDPTAGVVCGRVPSLAGKFDVAKTVGRQIVEIGETIAGER